MILYISYVLFRILPWREQLQPYGHCLHCPRLDVNCKTVRVRETWGLDSSQISDTPNICTCWRHPTHRMWLSRTWDFPSRIRCISSYNPGHLFIFTTILASTSIEQPVRNSIRNQNRKAKKKEGESTSIPTQGIITCSNLYHITDWSTKS
jgi:hypothetical protein